MPREKLSQHTLRLIATASTVDLRTVVRYLHDRNNVRANSREKIEAVLAADDCQSSVLR